MAVSYLRGVLTTLSFGNKKGQSNSITNPTPFVLSKIGSKFPMEMAFVIPISRFLPCTILKVLLVL